MKNIKIFCENDKKYYQCKAGTNLLEVSKLCEKPEFTFLCAYVDNELKELGFELNNNHKVKFLNYLDPDGKRTFMRSISFVLQKVMADKYPEYSLVIDYALPNGLYAELRDPKGDIDGSPKEIHFSHKEIEDIKQLMQDLINKDLPFEKKKLPNDIAVELFKMNGRPEKASLTEKRGKFFVSVYYLDSYPDTYYGPLLYSTSYINIFDLMPYDDGFCIVLPSVIDPSKLIEYKHQFKLSQVFKENSDWCFKMGAKGMVNLNEAIHSGLTSKIVMAAEALHERKYAKIADEISAKKDKVKLVLISGPSSSGKTTTSKRVALQTKIIGLNPVVIGMDDYFVERANTPMDENGDYNFESLYALDLPLLNKDLNELFEGKEIELPKFDFSEGRRLKSGKIIKLREKDILIMEGIHALNPDLLPEVANERIFKIYASALTSLQIDENNCVSTTDNRLLRRILRDYRTRGVSPEETIMRWPSVRRGEIKNIFPYQENADVMFNSTLIYELPLLRYYVESLLLRINPHSPAYSECRRLIKFLQFVIPMTPDEIKNIPPTSVMREFIGGSVFEY
ncbi:MAG: nucleoside kinase [Bacteroidales bacterium]